MSVYVMPLVILFVIVYAFFKRVNVYNSFCEGAKDGFNLVVDILPYICTIMLAIALMRYSGLGEIIIKMLNPIFVTIGIPSELTEFIMLRPFTGSGSLALLQDLINNFGADSRPARIASIIMGSSETVFFVSALYFSKIHAKNTGKAILMMLFINFIGVILSCLITNFI